MEIKTIEEAGAFWRPADKFPDDLPQVAFAGRSNVGKSSLINKLTNRRSLARFSSTPGKTRKVHFFRVNGGFYLVDLPGYGFAKLPIEVRDKWQRLIESYLNGSRGLRGVVCLIDIRHILLESDRRMLAYLASRGIPALVALTKADKLSRARQGQAVATLLDALEGAIAREQVLLTSARTGAGMNELRDALDELVRTSTEETNAGHNDREE